MSALRLMGFVAVKCGIFRAPPVPTDVERHFSEPRCRRVLCHRRLLPMKFSDLRTYTCRLSSARVTNTDIDIDIDTDTDTDTDTNTNTNTNTNNTNTSNNNNINTFWRSLTGEEFPPHGELNLLSLSHKQVAQPNPSRSIYLEKKKKRRSTIFKKNKAKEKWENEKKRKKGKEASKVLLFPRLPRKHDFFVRNVVRNRESN